MYKDFTIDEDSSSQLLLDGLVLELLPVHDEGKNSMNSISSTAGNQEIETDKLSGELEIS